MNWLLFILALLVGFVFGFMVASFVLAVRTKSVSRKGKERQGESNDTIERNIYVGNLADDVTEDDLRATFSSFGHVASVIVVKDKATGRPKGFGFVAMPAPHEAQQAINGLRGTRLKGRELTVSEAHPRTDGRHGKKGRQRYKRFRRRF